MRVTIHGEVVIVPTRKQITGVTSKYKSYIAGHSETGHHHMIESTTEFEVTVDELKQTFIRLFAPANIVHKKGFEIHETLPLAPGRYQIKPALEYSPFTKVMARQFD